MEPNAAELERLFEKLTALLYDTDVPMEVLEAEVMPYLGPDVTFVDPWQSGAGRESYRLGLAGFHAMFRFHFEVLQVGVRAPRGTQRGRAIVDGVMQLEQLSPLLVYPLRTIVTYGFDLGGSGRPVIHAHEEMWSFGDMLAAVPALGGFYSRVFRPAFSRGFLVASALASRRRARANAATSSGA